jgi:hypothetical protein
MIAVTKNFSGMTVKLLASQEKVDASMKWSLPIQ